jgi:predicted MFS family arabinose efflux permease
MSSRILHMPASAKHGEHQPTISRQLVLLLAVTCGAAAANLYYAQPLLRTVAGAFSVSNGIAGLLVTVTQIGYGLGLAFLVPLGDLLERRRLITLMLLASAAALAVAATASSLAMFAPALTLVGVTAAVAQIVVPMSSLLASEEQRGRVVGSVMSGLLIGILVARTASGLLAQALGWRAVYVVAAAAMLALAAALRLALPRVDATERLPYPALLRSTFTLVREESVLRQRMALGAAAMGCFSIAWTSLAFLLSAAPYYYGNAVIGLFGLAGLAGALMARVAGRLADRGRGRLATSGMIVLLLASWGLLGLGSSSVIALIAGIVVLDLGVCGLHVSNQNAIYELRPEARSRLTTAYMVAFFLGGAAMSATSSALYATGGWGGICVLGAVTAAAAVLIWLLTERARSFDPVPRLKRQEGRRRPPETCFHLYRSSSAEAVREAATRAGLPFERMTKAVSIPAPGHRGIPQSKPLATPNPAHITGPEAT